MKFMPERRMFAGLDVVAASEKSAPGLVVPRPKYPALVTESTVEEALYTANVLDAFLMLTMNEGSTATSSRLMMKSLAEARAMVAGAVLLSYAP